MCECLQPNHCRFNPHPPREGVTLEGGVDTIMLPFQSTPPREGVTFGFLQQLWAADGFNPHPPVRG